MSYNLKDKYLIHFELSNKCQAACPCCARNAGGVKLPWLDTKELFLDDIKKIMEGSSLLGSCNVLYCGNYGDPATARDLVPIIRWFQERTTDWRGRHQTVNTNGGIRDVKFWKELAGCFQKEAYTGRVTFSIDGLEDTNHIYRKNVNWKMLWRNLNTYIDAGGRARWEFLVFGHNKHQVDQAREIAEGLGMEFVMKRPFGFDLSGGQLNANPYIHAYDSDSYYEYSITSAENEDSGPVFLPEMQGNYKPTKKQPKSQNIIITDRENDFSKQAKINCKSLGYDQENLVTSQDIYIRSDGHLLPCCFMDGVTYNKSYNYGSQQMRQTIESVYSHLNVVDNNLDDVIMSSTVKKAFFDPMQLDSSENGKPMFCIDHCADKAPMDLLYRKYERE